MLHFLYNYIKGFYKLSYIGDDVTRLLNYAKKQNIQFWKMKQIEAGICFFVYKNNYSQLHTFSEKLNGKLEIKKKYGLRNTLFGNKFKIIMFLIMLIAITGYFILTTYIWKIDICGNTGYTEEEILKTITSDYVKIGTKIKKIDCEEIEDELRREYPNIAWINCSIDGTCLYISLSETIPKNVVYKNDEPCNIVATKDGIVSEIVIQSGLSMVKEGDEIKKGDILLTGVININNEYDEFIETEYIAAKGKVYAITKYTYEDSFLLEHYKKEYTGKEKKIFSLLLLKEWKIPSFEAKYDKYDILTEDYNLMLGSSYYFPIGIKENIYREYNLIKETYSEEEALLKSNIKLEMYLSGLQKKGVEILQNNVKIEVDDGKCISQGDIVVKEQIGIPSNITVFKEGED